MDIQQVNIFDEPIEECCSNPITGFFRDGFCHTDQLDRGLHIVCSLMNDEFLSFSKTRGNDLSTPRPEFDFPGLKAGDSWCVFVLNDGRKLTSMVLLLRSILKKLIKKLPLLSI